MSSEEPGAGDAGEGDASDGDPDETGDEGYVHEPGAAREAPGDDGRDRYVHDPSEFRGTAGGGGESATRTEGGEPFAGEHGEGLGRRGWALLVAVVLAFFGAPAVIYLRPPGVPFEVALLVVPLLPAFGLGVVAVWAMAGRRG